MVKPLLVLFGAGNIGRSFIAQVFARSGWRICFIDVNQTVITALNEYNFYDVIIRHLDGSDERLRIKDVHGVYGGDFDAVQRKLAEADLVATSVGASALPIVAQTIAAGLKYRVESGNKQVLDIILAENKNEAAACVKGLLQAVLPTDYPEEFFPGLVETSIGKMVPLIPEEVRRVDPLLVYAEAYNTLIVDKDAFRQTIPACEWLSAQSPITAWVERKLFIHNLGHACAAYLGYTFCPNEPLLATVLQHEDVYDGTRHAMQQAATALQKKWPIVFTTEDLSAHVDDLLQRFQNARLGDTVFRVGRDLPRKLGAGDRFAGALALCLEQGTDYSAIVEGYAAARHFHARSENGDTGFDDEALLLTTRDCSLHDFINKVGGVVLSAS